MKICDRDTGEELISPRDFPKLYDKVTHLHKDYLRALGALPRLWHNYHLTDKGRSYLDGLLSQG